MNWIKVNALECDYEELKNPTMINLDNVCYIEKHGDASVMITFTNGNSMSVGCSFEELATLLELVEKGYVQIPNKLNRSEQERWLNGE